METTTLGTTAPDASPFGRVGPDEEESTSRRPLASSAVRCPYCREAVRGQPRVGDPDEPLTECRSCATLLHEGCAVAHGRCTTLGCRGTLGRPVRSGRRGLRVASPPRPFTSELGQLPLGLLGALGLLVTILAALFS